MSEAQDLREDVAVKAKKQSANEKEGASLAALSGVESNEPAKLKANDYGDELMICCLAAGQDTVVG